MIRLVASDVDGTLLRREGDTIDPAVFVQIRRLMGAGVAFCAASGRQYNSLRRLFAPLGERRGQAPALQGTYSDKCISCRGELCSPAGG